MVNSKKIMTTPLHVENLYKFSSVMMKNYNSKNASLDLTVCIAIVVDRVKPSFNGSAETKERRESS